MMSIRITTALLVAAILSGCAAGADGPTPEEDPTDDPGATEEASDDDPEDTADDPVVIAHRHGETEVPADPERVVAVGFNDADVVLALGVVPLGERSLLGGLDASERPWFVEELDGADPPVQLGAEELDFEQVAALEPDLILGLYSAMTEDEYATLSEIAPTVAQPEEFVDFGVPWRDQLEITGRALGREDRADELLDEVEAEFAEAREAAPELDGAEIAVASAATAELYAYASDDLRTRFFTDLGLEVPDEIDELAGEAFFAEISREQAPLLDREVLVTYGEAETLEDEAFWSSLDVVDEGRTIYMDAADDLTNALGFSSPLSLPFALDGFVPRLQDALDDDPDTVPEPTS